jgi:wyosine [tRNA(Phe)-imidazoG37] synthetase (radical SAM superfamily)
MSEQGRYNYLFGPVPSRRLGWSLGVDLVPLKTCTQNCVYCQLGMNGQTTLQRKPYVPVDDVLDELKRKIDEGLKADYITLSGSGEPTLHSQIGDLIVQIHAMTSIPVAIITNGTLLSDPQVRAQCRRADLVVPSLDAGDAEVFVRINCPDSGLNFEDFVQGLIDFRKEYSGPYWLEVFFIQGLNTSEDQVRKMKILIDQIHPDRIQINTAIRPTTDPNVMRAEASVLEHIRTVLGDRAEIIADFSKLPVQESGQTSQDHILRLLARRPCRMQDISNGLRLRPQEVVKSLEFLMKNGKILSESKNGQTYYKAL